MRKDSQPGLRHASTGTHPDAHPLPPQLASPTPTPQYTQRAPAMQPPGPKILQRERGAEASSVLAGSPQSPSPLGAPAPWEPQPPGSPSPLGVPGGR